MKDLAPERSLSHAPLFQTMLSFQNTPERNLQVQGLSSRPFGKPSAGTEKFDLTLTMSEGPDGIAGSLSYDIDLFDATTIHRLVAMYERHGFGLMLTALRADGTPIGICG